MGRRPCCDNIGLNKGSWTAEEDKKLVNFVLSNYKCSWRDVPKHAGIFIHIRLYKYIYITCTLVSF